MTSLESKYDSFHGEKMEKPTMFELNDVVNNYDKEVTVSIHVEKSLPEKTYQGNMAIYKHVASKTSDCLSFMKTLKVEVITFVFIFGYVLRSVSSTTMIMDKVCYVHLDLSSEICNNLALYKDWKIKVETLANNYHMGHTLIGMLPSAILICFIGPWSDIYGRKLPLILALVGVLIDGFGATFCAYFLYSRVEYYMFTALFTGLSGGMISVMTIVYSYASDTTTSESRTFKYAIMEMAFGLGMPLGALAGGFIFKYSNYVPVFVTSVFVHLFGLFWVIVVLEETKGIGNLDSWHVKIQKLFSTDALRDSFRTTVKLRPNRGRRQIWMLMLSMSVGILTFASTSSIGYIYVHNLYNWTNSKYSTVSAVFSVLSLFVMLVSVPLLTRVFKVGDPILGLIGGVSLLAKNITLGLATQEWIYYLGSLLGFLSSTATLAGRSRISKVVSKNDLGKVFAFLSTAESVVPLIANAVFSQLFNWSLSFFPGLIYMVLSVFLFLSLGVYIWLATLPSVNYEEMTEEQKQADADAQDAKMKK